MRSQILINAVVVILSIISITQASQASEFNADDISSFHRAIAEAEADPSSSHKININGDIVLDSSIKEAVSLELAGSNNEAFYNFVLNGNTFTYDGAGKSSKISDLNIISNAAGSGINVNNQTFTVDNTHFSGDLSSNRNSFLSNVGGKLVITDSDFQNYKNVFEGGAINNKGGGSLYVSNTDFLNNSASNGSALYITSGSADIYNSDFLNNYASSKGGAAYISGGSLNLTDSNIKNNIAQSQGGGLYVDNSATVVIDNTVFDNNSVSDAANGGAIYTAGNVTIQGGSSFTNNKVVTGSGGAIDNFNGTLVIDNALFDNNLAKNDGGAITGSGSLTISNSKFSNNKSTHSIAGAIIHDNLTISNSIFENNGSGIVEDPSDPQSGFGGAIVTSDAKISDCTFSGNYTGFDSGGAIVNLYGTIDFNNSNVFTDNKAKYNGGALYTTTQSVTNINGTASFLNNKSTDGLGGGILAQGTVNINANNPDKSVIFSGNTDSTGTNAFHIDIAAGAKPDEVGTVNLNVSNGAKIIIDDNFSGLAGTKLNIKGTSSYNDYVCLGSENENFKGDVTAEDINLYFYNKESNLANANIFAKNTNFNFMNGYLNNVSLNLDASGGGNSLSLDVDPAALTCDYITLTGDPANITQFIIREVNVISDPIQSVTIFDIFDHDKYGTDLALSDELQNSIVYGALKQYKWSLTPKLTLTEIGGFNPNIQRFQGATAAAFMNQMLSYDYSLYRTDEIYTNLREQKLAARKLNSYASITPAGMYVDQYYADGSAFWMRPYVNIESFHLSGASGTVNNQSYGTMFGFDFPMIETKNDWKLFPTIYGAYIGSSQQYVDSDMYQNGGYGGLLLSAYKKDFYAGWTINGGGLGVESKYNSGKDDYAIVTAGTALKLAYNWKLRDRFILQPNFTTAYTFLSPSNLVNFQSLDINQSQVNGLTIAPSVRLTYRNEEGFEPYIFGGCVIPIMSDIKANVDGVNLDKLTLNPWAQFGAGVRRRIKDRVTCFAETVIRTGGRTGWGFMLNIQIAI